MSNKMGKDSEHDEIISLLPWFVNQTLDGHQREIVVNHMKNCAECQHEVEFLTILSKTVESDAQRNYSNRADVDKNLANVMNRIDADSTQVNSVTSAVSLLKLKFAKVFGFATDLSFSQWSMSAVAGLLVAVLGFQLYHQQSDSDYSVLSSSNGDESLMRLSVELASEANREQARLLIQQEFQTLGQQVEIESTVDGEFVIVLEDMIDVGELSKLVVRLGKEAQIERVEILP